MTHPAKFLCGHLAHGYEKCNGCVAEARTREIVELTRSGFSANPLWDRFVADAIAEKFLPKPADDDEKLEVAMLDACQCGDFRLATCGNCALAEGVSKGEEARTREIVANFDKIAREGSAVEAEFACWARAIVTSDFIPKEKP